MGTASLRCRSVAQPPQHHTAWKGHVAWPVSCGCAKAYLREWREGVVGGLRGAWWV